MPSDVGYFWTDKDVEYLENKWGSVSITYISKRLNRTVNAVKIKAYKLGLGRHLYSGEEITFNQLLEAINCNGGYSDRKKLFQKHNFPFRYKVSVKKRYLVVRINEFWEWAENNKNLIDFSRVEKNILGAEPSWVDTKRKADTIQSQFKKTPWTKENDSLLISLLNSYKYSYPELSRILKRTEGAIKRRIFDLKLKQRPLKADNHILWTNEEINLLKSLFEKGYSYEYIGGKVGKSALAVRGKVERMQKEHVINKGAALLMEMGCGKTLTAIAVAGRAYLDGKIQRLLVIAPTSVVPVWPKEIEEYGDFPFRVVALQGTMKERKDRLYEVSYASGLQIAVINYEATWRMIDDLMKWDADMIICDESQRIKNPQATQSKAIHKLGDKARYKLILSGTPVQNAPLDFYSQYRFLDKTIFGTSYYAFRARFAQLGGFNNKVVVAYQNLDELVRKAHSVAYRVTKKEALDLPETMDITRDVCLEPAAKKIYEGVRKENYAELESGGEISARNVLTMLLKLSQITGGFLKTDDGTEKEISSAKLDVLQEIIEDVLDSGKKLVIFARFVSEIKAIAELLQKLNTKYALIYGDIPQEERGMQVKNFQEEDECRVFIAQIQTAGLGITLTAADTAVFYSLDFNYANYSQARARTHRIGQKNKCTYYHLICRGTVDEKIMAALQSKEDIAKRVVDEWRDYLN